MRLKLTGTLRTLAPLKCDSPQLPFLIRASLALYAKLAFQDELRLMTDSLKDSWLKSLNHALGLPNPSDCHLQHQDTSYD